MGLRDLCVVPFNGLHRSPDESLPYSSLASKGGHAHPTVGWKKSSSPGRIRQREGQGEGAALAGGAGTANLSAVAGQDGLGDGKA